MYSPAKLPAVPVREILQRIYGRDVAKSDELEKIETFF